MSILSLILQPERFRQRVSTKSVGTLSGHLQTIPAISEFVVDDWAEPLLATNARKRLVSTRVSSIGTGRYGFSEVPLEDEDAFFVELYGALEAYRHPVTGDPICRARTGGEALQLMRRAGLDPAHLIVSGADLGTPDEVVKLKRLAAIQGYITEVDAIRTLVADLPKGCALLTAVPAKLGVYTRVGNYLGVLFLRVDLSMVLVEP